MAIACSAEEVAAFRAEKEAVAMVATRAKAQKHEPGQLSIQEAVKRMRSAAGEAASELTCEHDYERHFPSGPRGEDTDVCRKCGCER